MPIYKDLDVSQEINAVAQRIVGPDASAIEQGLGYRIAEAQITIRRVRAARNKLLADAINQPYYESRAATRAKAKVLLALLQHDASGWPAPQIEAYLLATPQGTEKFALILCQEFKRLAAMNRYEQRALSRRKFAIRELDQCRGRNWADDNAPR